MIVHELEEKIMNVWGTADDLDVVLHWIDDEENKQSPTDDDCLMNMIIGIKSLHVQRSKMLFEEFEKVLKSNSSLPDEVDSPEDFQEPDPKRDPYGGLPFGRAE